MNWRLVLGVIVSFVALSVNVGMLFDEEVVAGKPKVGAEQKQLDPLVDMQFTPAQREANAKRLGFDDAEVPDVLKRIGVLEQKYQVGQGASDLVRKRIDDTENADVLIASLCGRASLLPVRYAALQFLIGERDGALAAIDLTDVNELEPQQWWLNARAEAVYAHTELIKERKPDATRMSIAAILAKDQDSLLGDRAPWGRSIWNNWTWDGVKKKYPGVSSRLVEYVALLHVVVEDATAEGGLCDS